METGRPMSELGFSETSSTVPPWDIGLTVKAKEKDQVEGHLPSRAEGHLPVYKKDDLPRCVYDCRKTCENINMLDLMFERRALELGGKPETKGELIRSCYWMLNDLLDKGMTLTDVRYAIQTDVPLSEAKRVREHGMSEQRRDLEGILDELHEMLDSLRSSNDRQGRV